MRGACSFVWKMEAETVLIRVPCFHNYIFTYLRTGCIANLFCSTDQRSSLCRPNEIGRTWLSNFHARHAACERTLHVVTGRSPFAGHVSGTVCRLLSGIRGCPSQIQHSAQFAQDSTLCVTAAAVVRLDWRLINVLTRCFEQVDDQQILPSILTLLYCMLVYHCIRVRRALLSRCGGV